MTVAQILRDRLADIGRQRQPLDAAAFAAHDDLPRPPVKVVELKPGDLATAHSQPHQHHQDREIATPSHRRAVAAVQQPADLLAVEPTRQTRQPPARHRRHRPGQRARDQPLDVQEAHSERKLVTSSFADLRDRRPLSASRNPNTSAADSSRSSSRPAASTRDSTNGLTVST
jgi:hypothetical protein